MNILKVARSALCAYFDAVERLVDAALVEARNIAGLSASIELTEDDARRIHEMARVIREAGL